MKNLLVVLLIAVVAWLGYSGLGPAEKSPAPSSAPAPTPSAGPVAEVAGQQVSGTGIVERVLADDSQGSRHQRFILRLPSGQTLLVAHNVDIAPRIPALRRGDTVEYRGEYEPNDRGGVVHWTHRDPAGRHAAGWLKHRGQVFQ